MGTKNRTALIVGASDGIGKAVAKKFVLDGMNVLLFARRAAVLEDVTAHLREITGDPCRADWISGDITSEEDLRAAVQKTVNLFGGLDVLVNAAAAQAGGTVLDVGPEDYAHLFGVNVMGYGLAAKAAIPELLKSESPAIVNVASLNGCIGVSNRTLYNCTKAAVIEMTQSMACDFPAIRINCVSPGFTASDAMMTGLAATGLAPEECGRLISAGTLMKRMARPGEIANVIAFLASDAASYITGQNIVADGGALCYGSYGNKLEEHLREMAQ